MSKVLTVAVNLKALEGLPKTVRGAVERELKRIGMDLMGEAINEAPVEEGILRGSASLHVRGLQIATSSDLGAGHPEGTPLPGGAGTLALQASVVFNTEYAAYQHETMELNHPKGGKAKYLQDPFDRNQDQYEKRMAAAVAKELR